MAPSYVPNTEADREQMLAALGLPTIDALFDDIPPALRDRSLDLPPALSELELQQYLGGLAAQNLGSSTTACFRGAGSYRHFVPAVVGAVVSRGEFLTAYTPYQPEISQGTLQTIFEFQSLMCQLTGMDVANSGMYDGATALAEAALMACRLTGRAGIATLNTVNPRWRDVVDTYAQGPGIPQMVFAPDAVRLDERHACLLVQYPNFFGGVEDLGRWAELAHAAGALLVVAAYLPALGMLKPPGAYGADMVVAEGQPFGQTPSFGGPYVGVFCCRDQHVRQMPGRVVGRTNDVEGRTAYVLTLQTREQHIRRERATSNICTSQALVALASTVYLASAGPQGLREMAALCYHKAHYLASRLTKLPGFSLANATPFFNEFTLRCPAPPAVLNQRLLAQGVLGGLDVSDAVPNGWLLCCTEMNTRAELDALVDAVAGIAAEVRP
jgi:glycine dehydrogenase subunit 1